MKLYNLAIAIALLGSLKISAQQQVTLNTNDAKFLVTADLKYSYRFGGSGDYSQRAQNDYTKKLNSGLSYDFSAYYLFNQVGIGLKYSVHRASGELNNAVIDGPDNYIRYSASRTDDINISFYGGGFIYEIATANKWISGYVEAGIGYMQYSNTIDLKNTGDFKLKGGTLGAYVGVSYLYEVADHFLIGPKLNVMIGSLSEVEMTYPYGGKELDKVENNDIKNLSSINIGLTAAYRF